MKGYERYKQSNFPWINEVPYHWNIYSLNHVVEFIMGQAPHSDSYNTEGSGTVFIKTGDFTDLIPIVKWYTTTPLVYASKNDVFICVVGATCGKVNLGIDGTISRSIAALRPKKLVLQKYLFYYLSFNYISLNDSAQGSAQGIINKSILASIKIPIPPLSEQIQIASFLDKKTALIDEIIAKKERLIETLQAKRQATINEVVTGKKVWNPKTNTWTEASKVKNSGIDWLGEIPEDWEVVKLKYLVSKVGSGVTPRGGGEVYYDEGVIFVRSQNVHFDGLRLEDIVRIDIETHENMSGSKVQRNDVLLNITGASIGRCCVVNVDDEINVNQHVSILRTNERVFPYFLNLVLQSSIGQLQVNLKSSGGNREGLTAEAIKTFIIPLPKKNEQLIIIDKLGELISHFETTIFRIQTQIQKLKEYRQSLISEAVTGKIDVRDWQALGSKA